MQFPYQQSHGILRYFFETQRSFYEEVVTFTSSSDDPDYPIFGAFDFNESTYWLARYSYTNIWMSFCLNLYYVKLTHYEISTTSYGNRPTKWSFSVSTDGVNYINEINESYSMNQNEIYSVSYKTNDYYRCFKFSNLGLTSQNEYCVDIRQFELFGTVINLPDCTLYDHHYFRFRYSIFHFILFLSK